MTTDTTPLDPTPVFRYAPGTIVVKIEHERGNTIRGPIDIVFDTHLATGWRMAEAFVEPDAEQADREPSERLMVAPAIQAVRDVLDGLEDWEIQDHALEEIRSAVDDIPDCESATAIPHEDHGEPSDAERMAAARAINLAGWTCYGGVDEPGQFDTCEDCQRVCLVVADAALLAAQEVRNRG